ncbi:hypothetical protein NP493_591g01008 [Ridgeia piscesae]|uniref:RRM domain-containing protein n=1 Tax=Ridgeia piscesae TaxID=27915 RepID=A0AAD9KVB1_RIDPI|nr:hypothetical protein NP493_591g01008 [Ridgeia piscesae]
MFSPLTEGSIQVSSESKSPKITFKYRNIRCWVVVGRSRGNRRHHSRSRSHSHRRYRSRSRSYSPYGRRKHSRHSSRSRSPYGRRSGGGSPNHRRSQRSHSRSPMSNRRRHVCSRDDPKSSRCLGIFGLSLYTQEKDLRDVFGQYGPIEEVQVVYDHQTGRSRGFAFIYFRCTDDAVEQWIPPPFTVPVLPPPQSLLVLTISLTIILATEDPSVLVKLSRRCREGRDKTESGISICGVNKWARFWQGSECRSRSYSQENSPVGSFVGSRHDSGSVSSQKEASKSPVRAKVTVVEGIVQHHGLAVHTMVDAGMVDTLGVAVGHLMAMAIAVALLIIAMATIVVADDPKSSRCLGIFGLSLYTQEKDLRDVFGQYGPIEEVQVVYDHQTGRSRGFAFIYFRCVEDAVEAKDQATGIEIDGRRIRVDFSITERAHTPTPGIYLGKPTSSGYRRRSPSPYYRRRSRYSYSRSRSRSYSPRRY